MILHLAAHAPELAALDSTFPKDVVGIGLVEASLGAARVLAKHRPSEVVLLGTCGAFRGSGLSIGDVVVGAHILLSSPTGEMVEAMPRTIDTDAGLSSRFAGASVTVATTLAITTDDALARLLAERTGAHAEHLEAFAVARACQLAGVAFTVVLGVANHVGARGREEWRANQQRAGAAACAAVRSPTRGRSPA
jgi:futalosine hydrolase